MIGQLFDLTHTMQQDHLLKALIGFWVANDAHERRQTCTGTNQIQALCRCQIVNQQRARGLTTHHNGVAHLNMLQSGGQGTVLHFDAQKFEVLFIIGTGNAVGAQKRLAILAAQANHGEMTIRKTQRLVAGGGKAKQAIGPVMNAQYFFF